MGKNRYAVSATAWLSFYFERKLRPYPSFAPAGRSLLVSQNLSQNQTSRPSHAAGGQVRRCMSIHNVCRCFFDSNFSCVFHTGAPFACLFRRTTTSMSNDADDSLNKTKARISLLSAYVATSKAYEVLSGVILQGPQLPHVGLSSVIATACSLDSLIVHGPHLTPYRAIKPPGW